MAKVKDLVKEIYESRATVSKDQYFMITIK